MLWVMSAAPRHPKHPERVCWGCDRYCPADDLACGNGSVRTPHPVELFGEDWDEWAAERPAEPHADSDDSRSEGALSGSTA